MNYSLSDKDIIKLLKGRIDLGNVEEKVSTKNGTIIKEEAQKGKIYLLWKQRDSNIEMFLSVIEKVRDDGFEAEQFRIDTEGKICRDKGNMLFRHMNIASFEVYILTKEEAQPYLNGLIVSSLQG